jgi:integrase
MKLTQTVIDRLTLGPDERERIVWDDEVRGYGVRMRRGVRERVLKRHIVQYRSAGGSQRRQTLGDANVVRCVAAKAKAREILARVKLGEDPQAAKAAARRVVTFLTRAKEYLHECAHKWRPSTGSAVRRQLLSHASPLHPRPVEQVTRAEIAGLVARIAREKGRIIANRTRTALSGMFAWCVVHHELSSNPTVGIPHNGEASRDRVLTDDELAAIWNATDDNSDFSRIVRLLILTACRRNEIGQMRWSEVAGGVFTLPASRSKNKRSHEVWLHPLAVSRLPPRDSARDALFGQSERGFSGWGFAKTALDKRLGQQIQSWRLHDLRRSAATWMAENGVEPAHVDAVLNHASGIAKRGIRATYNRAEYREPKRRALAKWAEHIAEITGQDVANVAALGQPGQRA